MKTKSRNWRPVQLGHRAPGGNQAEEKIGITDIAVLLVESSQFLENILSINCSRLAEPHTPSEERAQPNQCGKPMRRRRFHHEQESTLVVHKVAVRVDERRSLFLPPSHHSRVGPRVDDVVGIEIRNPLGVDLTETRVYSSIHVAGGDVDCLRSPVLTNV